MGLKRESQRDKEQLVGTLLDGIFKRKEKMKSQLLISVSEVLIGYVPPPKKEENKMDYALVFIPKGSEDKDCLLEFFQKVLLHRPNALDTFKFSTREYNFDELEKLGVAISRIIGTGGFGEKSVTFHIVLGLLSSSHKVNSICERYMKKRNVDVGKWFFFSFQFLENKDVVLKMMKFFLGKLGRVPTNEEKIEILKYLVKSKIATDMFPHTEEIVKKIFSGGENLKVKQKCIEFCRKGIEQGFFKKQNYKYVGSIFVSMFYFIEEIYDSSSRKINTLKEGVYTLFAELIRSFPKLLLGKIETFKIVEIMFKGLGTEPVLVRTSIQQSISIFISGYKKIMTESLKRTFENFLFMQISNSNDNPDICYSALFCVNKLFPFNNVSSRVLNFLCLDSSHLKVRDEAGRGNNILYFTRYKEFGNKSEEVYPEFEDVVLFIETVTKRENIERFSDEILLGMLDFLRICIVENSKAQEMEEKEYIQKKVKWVVFQKYVKMIESTFSQSKNVDSKLVNSACDSFMQCASYNDSIMNELISEAIDSVMNHLFTVEVDCKFSISEVFALMYVFVGEKKKQKEIVLFLFEHFSSKKSSARIISTAVLTVGHIIGCCCEKNIIIDEKLVVLFNLIVDLLNTNVEMVVEAAIFGLGTIGLCGGLDISSRETFSMKKNDETQEAVEEETQKSNITKKRKVINRGTIVQILLNMLPTITEEDTTKDLLLGSGSIRQSRKIQNVIIDALGKICSHDYDKTIFERVSMALFKFRKTKKTELLFSIGECFSCLIGCSSVHRLPFLPEEKIKKWITKEHKVFSKGLLIKLLTTGVLSPIRVCRLSSSVWLLSIVKFCKDNETIRDYVADFQNAFCILITDSNEITRDVASKGLTYVYEMSGDEQKKKLVDELMQRFTGKVVHFKKDLLLFNEIDAMENEKKGAVKKEKTEIPKTYKELCSIAQDVGSPNLIYKLMNISHQNQIWNSKKAAAFSTIDIIKKHSNFKEMKQVLPKILPKLYRYQFDPVPEISRSMTEMWKSLVDDTHKTMEKYMRDIVEEISSKLNDKLWRTRESCCTALVSIFSYPCDFFKIRTIFLELLRKLFRVTDDVKESCRKKAVKALTKVGKYIIKTCNEKYTTKSVVESAMLTIVPFILKEGIKFPTDVVKLWSISQINEISKIGKGYLKPFCVETVSTTLVTMSMFQNQKLNYLSSHAKKIGISQEKLDEIQLRLVGDHLHLVDTINYNLATVDKSNIDRLVEEVLGVLDTAVSILTRVHSLKVIIHLSKLKQEFVSRKLTGRLIVYIINIFKENTTIPVKEKNAMVEAIAYLLKLASKKRAVKCIKEDIIEFLYFKKEEYKGVSLLFKKLLEVAPMVFTAYSALILPIIFLTQFNSNEKVSKMFKELWNESVESTEKAAIMESIDEFLKISYQMLDGRNWTQKVQGARSLEETLSIVGDSLKNVEGVIFEIKKHLLTKRNWKGKHRLVASFSKAIVTKRQSKEVVSENINILVSLLGNKQKPVFKLTVLEGIDMILDMYYGDINETTLTLLQKTVVEYLEKCKMRIIEVEKEDNSVSRNKTTEKVKREQKFTHRGFVDYLTVDEFSVLVMFQLCCKMYVKIEESFSWIGKLKDGKSSLRKLERLQLLRSFGWMTKRMITKKTRVSQKIKEMAIEVFFYNLDTKKINNIVWEESYEILMEWKQIVTEEKLVKRLKEVVKKLYENVKDENKKQLLKGFFES